MSSKLVKQQLASLINSGVSSKKSSKKNKKRVVKRAHDASQEQPIVESNLKYYKKTKGPDGNTKELLEKLLHKKGFPAEASVRDDEFDDEFAFEDF